MKVIAVIATVVFLVMLGYAVAVWLLVKLIDALVNLLLRLIRPPLK